MIKATSGQEQFLLTTTIHVERYYKINNKTLAVGSRTSSKLIFVQGVWDTSIARTTGFM